MLSISNALKGADCGEYYLRISSEEYYARSGSERGKFFGGAIGSLVQSSEFNREQFARLLEGFDERGMALVQNAGHEDRWRGWDLTLSAPKSVSVLWALSSKKYRRLIRKAHDRAVRDALRWIEEHHCITRRGKGGSVRENAHVLFALFFHFESRLHDPQLHTHSLLLNVAMRADGSTGALHSIDFFRAKMEAGEIYRKALKANLFSLLRLSFVDEENGFRIVGIPQEVCSQFSKRRAEMEKKMAELGLQGPVAAKDIALKTRKRKVELQKSTLFQRWCAEAEQCGWGPKHAKILLASGRVQKRWEKNESRQTGKVRIYQETPLERAKRRAAEMLVNVGEARDEETKSVNSLESARTTAARRSFLNSKNSQTDGREENSHFASDKNSIKPRKKTASRAPGKKKRKNWGRVIWRNSWLVNEVRLQERYLFPNAPAWTGLNKLAERRFRVVSGPPVKEKATVWQGTIGPLKTEISTRQAFRRAPTWSPAKHIRVPKVSFMFSSEGVKQESKSTTHGHSH